MHLNQWEAKLSKTYLRFQNLNKWSCKLGEKAFIRTNIVLLVLFKMQTTGITSHYLQASLRNILQEEGISSRCSKPPYLLKVISSLVALKDTYPVPFLGKDQRNPHATTKRLLDANRKCQELVQASSTSARLGETMEYY